MTETIPSICSTDSRSLVEMRTHAERGFSFQIVRRRECMHLQWTWLCLQIVCNSMTRSPQQDVGMAVIRRRFHVGSAARVAQVRPSKPEAINQPQALRRLYSPGEKVPGPGTYIVHHVKHRASHAAKLRIPAFPACAQCQSGVRFEPIHNDHGTLAEWLRRDPDFQQDVRRMRLARAAPQKRSN